MHAIWNEMEILNVAEQRLMDEKNNIFKRKCLSDLELEEIQRNIEDIVHNELGLEGDENEEWFLGFDHEGQDVFIKDCEVVIEDYMVPDVLRRNEAMFL